jgi:hypothetical protein
MSLLVLMLLQTFFFSLHQFYVKLVLLAATLLQWTTTLQPHLVVTVFHVKQAHTMQPQQPQPACNVLWVLTLQSLLPHALTSTVLLGITAKDLV